MQGLQVEPLVIEEALVLILLGVLVLVKVLMVLVLLGVLVLVQVLMVLVLVLLV